jgi:hypothetical protein
LIHTTVGVDEEVGASDASRLRPVGVDGDGVTVTRLGSLGAYTLWCRMLFVGVAAGRVKDDVGDGFAPGRT